MLRFIGLDLAWSPRNRSGAAAIEGDEAGGTLVDVALLGDDADVLAYIDRHAGAGPAVVAVDAPLRVPNTAGRRPAEAAISAAFRRYEAGAHPANRRRLAFDGEVRGEALVQALAAHGFAHTAGIEAGVRDRRVVEVFPHPAMVAIFGLDRTLKYKARPNRSHGARLSEWRRYQALLRGLTAADPPLHGHQPLLDIDPAALRPARLKDYEDQVDALMCAYIGLYAARWGASRCRVFGTLDEGSIFTPVPAEMRRA